MQTEVRISKEQSENIFDRFTRLENKKKDVGLGLAIKKEAADV